LSPWRQLKIDGNHGKAMWELTAKQARKLIDGPDSLYNRAKVLGEINNYQYPWSEYYTILGKTEGLIEGVKELYLLMETPCSKSSEGKTPVLSLALMNDGRYFLLRFQKGECPFIDYEYRDRINMFRPYDEI
jgi:hypothetical protein